MRRAILMLMFALGTMGCQGVHRLIDGPQSPASAPAPKLLDGNQLPTDPPEFNVVTPSGYTRVVFYGALPSGGVVRVQASQGSLVDVFMMQRAIGQWSILNNQYSGAFWYTFDANAGTVTYQGEHLENVAYCIYEYVKN